MPPRTIGRSCVLLSILFLAGCAEPPGSLSAQGYHDRATVWHRQGDLDKAIRDYGKAIERDPQCASAYSNRGNIWQMQGDHARAIADYNEALLINSNFETAYYNRAFSYIQQGKMDGALDDFDRAIQLAPSNANYFICRGNVWYEKREVDKSIDDYTEAIRLSLLANDMSVLAALYDRRGSLRGVKGDYTNAMEDWFAAIRTDPKNPSGYNNMAWLLATAPLSALRNGEKAVKIAQRACDLSHFSDPMCIDTLAAAYAESGDFDQAKQLQKLAIEKASEEKREELQARLELYQSDKPYHSSLFRPASWQKSLRPKSAG